MRKLSLLALVALLVAGGTVAAVTAAGAREERAGGERAGAGHGHGGPGFARHRGGGGGPHGFGFGPARMLLRGVAERLGVSPQRLRQALAGVKRRQLDRAVERGTITAAERDALLACMPRARAACDRAAARAAARKLHAARRDFLGNLPARKDELLTDLAAELGKPKAQVDAAIRAELAELADRAVRIGFLTPHGRELALACYDRPQDCDLRRLRAQLRLPFGGPGHRGPRGRGG